MSQQPPFNTIQEPIDSASKEIREVIERVLQLERNRLYKKSLKSINDDVLAIIKEEIQ